MGELRKMYSIILENELNDIFNKNYYDVLKTNTNITKLYFVNVDYKQCQIESSGT